MLDMILIGLSAPIVARLTYDLLDALFPVRRR
jgi:hypothetical protein